MSDDTPKPNYSGNSKKQKKEEADRESKPKLERVTSSEVKIREPMGLRISRAMTGADGRSVMETVIFDVAIPAFKALVSDAVSQGIDRLLFGETRARRSGDRYSRSNYNPGGSRATYRSETSSEPRGRSLDRGARARFDFSNLLVETRIEAEEVLGGLDERISRYGEASVSDFYDLMGISSEFTDEKWGWTDLHGSMIVPKHGEYNIKLPQPKEL